MFLLPVVEPCQNASRKRLFHGGKGSFLVRL